jgi:hypothetical protein
MRCMDLAFTIVTYILRMSVDNIAAAHPEILFSSQLLLWNRSLASRVPRDPMDGSLQKPLSSAQ